MTRFAASFVEGTDVVPHRVEFAAFDTVVWLSAFGPKETVRKAFADARRACERYERLFSRTIPTSDIARINAAAGRSVTIDEETYLLLCAARTFCEKSHGHFDVTVGPLVRLWDFKNGVVPSREALLSAATHVNWRQLEIREEPSGQAGSFFARLADPQGALDAGGIAKGYIADRLVELLMADGVQNFTVNLGGNVVVKGSKPNGQPWTVGIRNPSNPGNNADILGALPLRDASIVTSGITERGFLKNGVWYHHILSPATGMPVKTDLLSVSVIAQTSLEAEGYSTTLVALGQKEGLAFARETPGILSALFIDQNNHLVQS